MGAFFCCLDAQNGLTFTGTARRRFSPLSAGSSVLDAIVAIILEQPPSAPVARHIERVESRFRELSVTTLSENDYGQYDELIRILSPALGPAGLEQLKERFLEFSKASPGKPKDKDRKVLGWGSGGPLYADEIAASRRQSIIRRALQDIADAQGDVDAFIAQQSETAKTVPRVAAEIARRSKPTILDDPGQSLRARARVNVNLELSRSGNGVRNGFRRPDGRRPSPRADAGSIWQSLPGPERGSARGRTALEEYARRRPRYRRP
jgi:hypothetical protein